MHFYKNADGDTCVSYHCNHCATPLTQTIGESTGAFVRLIGTNPGILTCAPCSLKGGKNPKSIRLVRC